MNENPPMKPDIAKLIRHILVEKPRVTKFQIDWDDHMVMAAANNENNQNTMNMMQNSEELTQQEGLMSKGTQFQDRNDMMSSANLAAAAQTFQQ